MPISVDFIGGHRRDVNIYSDKIGYIRNADARRWGCADVTGDCLAQEHRKCFSRLPMQAPTRVGVQPIRRMRGVSARSEPLPLGEC
jgi:hypothetical protein